MMHTSILNFYGIKKFTILLPPSLLSLQNIVATGAGFVDGLGYGNNTKASVIRLGLMEMIKFIELLYPSKVSCLGDMGVF